MNEEVLLTQIAKRLETLESKVDSFAHTLLVPVTQLVERERGLTKSLDFSWETLRDTQKRLKTLEERQPISALTSSWVIYIVFSVLGALSLFVWERAKVLL